ncbi:ribosomal protein S18 acetylase RimI-like enzyme [Kitasatospora sp. MAP12-15]|uniref:GNAT family N-acetyltransferase n=1 Tax=unclassified Kitasatospora TaxID=2633591 RepID=UPI0024762090|nr:GNAT family N-acetyltransferase [Kitasatospora sp. MAP12-44]MDH6112731.1 ribosomal protein S18 acetylase RimI-like enzyme [Kitasatospora sp. MAP12-44]
MDILIRTALDEDLDAAGEVTVEAFVGDGHTPPGAEYVTLLRDARRRAAEAELLVAVDPADTSRGPAGRVLGCVTFAVGGTEWADIATPQEGEIRMLAAAADARGRGVGESLVRACVARSRELGLTGMAFSTRPAMSAAHRIYERVGFLRTPERDWRPRPDIELWVYSLTF